jgi:hypothetical protein
MSVPANMPLRFLPAQTMMSHNQSHPYPTIDTLVGNTPLVRLQRLPGNTSNTLLVKLEGNNPAGSVKDRPALSMISKAEARGTIKPGDTLIEATSGNTGIALAMVAAMKGYHMILIMPANATQERKDAMTAYGATLIEVSETEGMEGARDLATRMESEGKGRVLDQFANPDNYAAHYGHHRYHHGCFPVPEGKESRHTDCRIAAAGRLEDSRHTSLARGLPAQDIRT